MAEKTVWKRTFERQVSRRRFVQGASLGAIGLAAGAGLGCGSSGPASPTGAVSSTPTAADQPVRGGTLTVLQGADIVPRSGPWVYTPDNLWLQGMVYDTVIRYRTDRLEAEPQLAESWKFSADYTSLTLKLRSGVTFHTGQPLTAADVKWNLEWIATADAGSQMMSMAQWIKKMETPDSQTLILYFDQPRPSILDMFETTSIGDPKAHQDTLDGKRFVGTGPFVFKEWVPGDHLTVVRNPNYWQKDIPYLDQIVFKIMPDPQTQLMNLQTGAADVALRLEPRDAKSLEKDKNFWILVAKTTASLWYMGADVKVPAFADKRVRQAMAALVDRKRIVDTQLFYGQPTSIPWDSSSPAYDAELVNKLTYDQAKAKQLIAQAGGTPTQTIPITISASYAENVPMAEMVQAELAAIGWKTSIEKMPHAEYLVKWRGGTYGGLWFGNVGFMYMDPSTLFVTSLPYKIPNCSNYDSPEYRKMIDDSLKTSDPAALKKLYRQLNELWLDECFVIPVSPKQAPYGVSAKVKNLSLCRGLKPNVAGMWKAK